jgi:pimeloyl-ACP methyl ester carboxylesterase
MPFATVNGIKINYVIEGSGPPLLMFAPGGFWSVIANWTARDGKNAWKEMDGLATLARHYTIIAYDRREAGLSGGRVEPLTWDAYVSEAVGMLDLAGAKQAYILGGCMGASLVAALAVRHPSRCKGLILHWPVGGYQWMMKGRTLFDQHIAFVRAHGLQAVVARAQAGKNFWSDGEGGPWATVIAADAAFAASYAKQDVAQYLSIVEKSRDTIFNDTMPSGASGAELMRIQIPSLIVSGADASHTVSSSWALKELMPNAERWDVIPPQQNAQNTLEQILRFTARFEGAAVAA